MTEKYIICVDDEQIILNTLNKQITSKFGNDYTIEIAESGEEALELLEELTNDGEEVVMMISDQIMPGMKGDELLAQAFTYHKEIITILLTGQADLEATVNAINNANLFRYLSKPWDEEDLLLTISKGLDQYYLINKLNQQVATFSKFVPTQFLEHLGVKEYQDISLGLSKNEKLCTFFLDIRNFTTFSETHKVEEVVALLNNTFSHFSKIITDHKGFIDKFIGDAVMAIFSEANTTNAVWASVNIVKKLKELKQKEILPSELNIGIGLSLGDIMIGTIGAEERIDSTVIGDSVNMSSRIEGITKSYSNNLLVTQSVYEAVKSDEELSIRLLDCVPIKGKALNERIYEVFNSDDEEVQTAKKTGLKEYEQIIERFINGEEFADDAKAYLQKYPQDAQAKIVFELKKIV